MRTFIGCCCSLLAIVVASPALADDTAPPAAITINGGATVVTDYRFRGLSQTNKNFAVQGSLTATHSSGFYVSVWGSSIDDYVANGSNQEIDLIAGYKRTFSGTTIDGGFLYYFYPNSNKFTVPGTPKYNSDFGEPYISVAHTFGPLTAKATANYAFKQKALALFTDVNGDPIKRDNLYGALDFSAAIPKTAIGLTGHVGHNFTRSFLSANREYTDWGAGVNYTWKQITFGVSWVDTNIPNQYLGTKVNGGNNIAKGGVVGSVGVSF
ncbi:hypothetical protein D3Y57_12645 [Sphingomonas paeninsulae]|jgi:uncharacterized protein (TIGR02001 family)|uniref:Uncharacterized protein n=1 Tax=Sphingomonas paeninsulae TaxID=2319844 RepID=A0A494TB86_SPHPE|nr:TorF family putative porin [Sphingomonas paeninsulae]AYJ86657.1 hypothetical protein D3Y57_12645 [Sphingomonas paeninsulae]